jgi:hypothetical protein
LLDLFFVVKRIQKLARRFRPSACLTLWPVTPRK